MAGQDIPEPTKMFCTSVEQWKYCVRCIMQPKGQEILPLCLWYREKSMTSIRELNTWTYWFDELLTVSVFVSMFEVQGDPMFAVTTSGLNLSLGK